MRAAVLLVLLSAVACGSGASSGAAQIRLTAAGASPNAIAIPNGGQVQFDNQDSAAHQIASPDCPELASPSLAPGGNFLATLSGGPRSCSFGDALNPSATAFKGSVTVNAPTPGGGGGGGGY